MGYTHYWRQSRAFTDAEWAAITAETKRILEAAGKTIPLRGGMGTGKPAFDAESIAFNGAAPRDDHETFLLEKAPENPEWRKDEPDFFAFCKTARKPYDPVVVSVLWAVRNIAPDAIKVSSDGGDEAIRLLF